MVKPSRQRASAHVVLFCAATAIDDAGAEINCDVCHTSFCMKPNLIVWDLDRARPQWVRGRQHLVGKCKHRCDARERLTRPGGILDGAIEKEVSNGSRHGPLPERIH